MKSREFWAIYAANLLARYYAGRAWAHIDEATALVTGHHPFWCRVRRG